MPTVKVDEGKCTGCGECISACPMDVLVLDKEKNKSTVANPSACIGCRACEAACKFSAIKVTD